jgi:hypothetical protein
MAFCKMADIVYAALPLRPLRGLLIRRHMESCPRCQARLLSRAEARRLFVAPDEVGDTEALWARVGARAARATAAPERAPAGAAAGWSWAAAAAAALTVAVTGFWLLRQVEKPGLGPGILGAPDRFEISYVNVGGAPAQTFIYQPQGSDVVFVWAAKNP